jgi:hypothetical protein
MARNLSPKLILITIFNYNIGINQKICYIKVSRGKLAPC